MRDCLIERRVDAVKYRKIVGEEMKRYNELATEESASNKRDK
jgi:hypothetical protein